VQSTTPLVRPDDALLGDLNDYQYSPAVSAPQVLDHILVSPATPVASYQVN
jgi:hypothetical protein